MSSQKSINYIINDIANSVNKNWSKEEQIRYVYITLGKLVSKNVRFFYSLGDKLEAKNYTYTRLKNVYESKKLNSLSVICKSAALMLQRIYSKLGINSTLIKTIDYGTYKDKNSESEFNIHHYFLCVDGSYNRRYFLTIIPDLYNIQYGFSTKHFANNIDYERIVNGKKEQVYEGEKINVYPMSEDEIRELDESIGYITPYYALVNGKIIKKSDYNDVFIEFLREFIKKDNYQRLLGLETTFYKKASAFQIESGLTAYNYLNGNNVEVKKLESWFNYLKQLVSDRFDEDDPLYKDSIGKVNGLKKAIENKNGEKFRIIYELLCANFIKSKYKYKKNSICTTKYITKKFGFLFPRFFSCNEINLKPITAQFKGIAEQLDFIDLFIDNMFLELKIESANYGHKINPKYSLIRNRIQRYVILDKLTNEYNIIFSIDNSNIYFYFNPNTGEFRRVVNILEILSDHNIIISDELKNQIKNVEKIERKKRI